MKKKRLVFALACRAHWRAWCSACRSRQRQFINFSFHSKIAEFGLLQLRSLFFLQFHSIHFINNSTPFHYWFHELVSLISFWIWIWFVVVCCVLWLPSLGKKSYWFHWATNTTHSISSIKKKKTIGVVGMKKNCPWAHNQSLWIEMNSFQQPMKRDVSRGKRKLN